MWVGDYSLPCDDFGGVGALEVEPVVSFFGERKRRSETQDEALKREVACEEPARNRHPAERDYNDRSGIGFVKSVGKEKEK